jgi:lipocalin-like protein
MSNPLVGTWRLVSWENRTVDGRISYPLGDDAAGFILYTDDGYMAVAIMRRGRESFAAEDLLGGSRDEKAHAAETYVSYCGRYEYRGDSVIHYVELSLFPNWSGVEQERLVEVAGNRLNLSTRPMVFQGIQQSAHLVWERA